jgi:glyoxylase-like metal-dependent hydrolase (beta-lactamase superfamily II)
MVPGAVETNAKIQSQMALYAMDCGHLSFKDTDFYADDGSFKGVSREMTNPCYLIRHGSEYLLWDLGMPDSLAESRGRFVPREGIVLTMSKSLVGQLAELDLKPADIDFIAISHGHFDHIGNGGLFGRATFLVDEREHRFMFGADARAEALRSVGIHSRELAEAYSVLEGSKTVKIPKEEAHDVFGDNSVVIYPAPGHTPGHRVLLVRLPEAGTVLLTGDMYHLAESREKRTVPRRNDRAQTLASIDVVEKLAVESRARVIRQHVPGDFSLLPPFPQGLR